MPRELTEEELRILMEGLTDESQEQAFADRKQSAPARAASAAFKPVKELGSTLLDFFAVPEGNPTEGLIRAAAAGFGGGKPPLPPWASIGPNPKGGVDMGSGTRRNDFFGANDPVTPTVEQEAARAARAEQQRQFFLKQERLNKGFPAEPGNPVGEPIPTGRGNSPLTPNAQDSAKMMEWLEAESLAGRDPMESLLEKLDKQIGKDQKTVDREMGDKLAKQRAKFTRGLEGRGERRVLTEAGQQRDFVRGNVKDLPSGRGPLPAAVGTGLGTGAFAGMLAGFLPSAVFVSEFENTQELGGQLEFLADQHDRPLRPGDLEDSAIEELVSDPELLMDLVKRGLLSRELAAQVVQMFQTKKAGE